MIQINRVLDRDYTDIIYISHPYGSRKENEDRVAKILLELQKEYPDYLFISPIHCYSWLYEYDDYEKGLARCLWLLEKCNRMWVYGDYQKSRGCVAEIEYAHEHKIPYVIKE